MRRRFAHATGTLMLGFVSALACAQLMPTQQAWGQAIVRFSPSAYSRLAQSSDILGNRIIGRIPVLGSVLVATVGPESVAQVRQLPGVKTVTPNWLVQLAFTPNDPMLNAQWHLGKINAFTAWDIGRGSASTPIAIVDTGIQYTHPDLAAVYLNTGYDFGNSDNDPLDGFGHGTLVAGVASAATNNAIGVAGVGFGCPVIAIKVTDQNGQGTVFAMAQGISYAVTNTTARVINVSLGTTSFDQTLKDACQQAYDAGVVLVAAAGNNNNSIPFYPANFSTCVAVGATDQSDARWTNSNFGTDWVTVAAPGQDIYSTNLGSGYGSISGTSLAAPVVSGLAALLYNKQGPGRSKVKAAIVRSSICAGAANVAPWSMFGRVDALDSMRFASSVAPLSFTWSPSSTYIIQTTTDTAGNVFAAYAQHSNVTGDDIAVEKRDPNGTLIWRRILDGIGRDDEVRRLAVDTDGSVYVAGQVLHVDNTNDALVARYSSAGTLVWKRLINGPANAFDAANALTFAGDKVVVAGYWSVAGPSNRLQAVWVLRKSNGTTFTAKTIAHTGNVFDEFLDAATRPDGKVYLVARMWFGVDTNSLAYLYDPATNAISTLGAYNNGPGAADEFSVVRLAANGDAIVGGTSTLSTDKVVLARVRGTGGFAWLKVTNGVLTDLVVGANDQVGWCGCSGIQAKFVVGANDGANGTAIWKREFGGLGDLATRNFLGQAKRIVRHGTTLIATGNCGGAGNSDAMSMWLNADTGKLLRVARYDAGAAEDSGRTVCYSKTENKVYVGIRTLQANGGQFRLLKYAP